MIKYVDAKTQTEITTEQQKYFTDNGFLVIRNALCQQVCSKTIVTSCYRAGTRQFTERH